MTVFRRHLIALTLIALLAPAVSASAETTSVAVKKAYKQVLAAVDDIYNANGQMELGLAASRLDRVCKKSLRRISRTKPRSVRLRRIRRLALRGLRECRRAADLFDRASRLPDNQEQHNLRQAGEKSLKKATDDLDAANRALMR